MGLTPGRAWAGAGEGKGNGARLDSSARRTPDGARRRAWPWGRREGTPSAKARRAVRAETTVSWLSSRSKIVTVMMTTGFPPPPLAAARRAVWCTPRPASGDGRASRATRIRMGTPRARGAVSPPRPIHAGRRDSAPVAADSGTRAEASGGRSEGVAAGTRVRAPFARRFPASTISDPRRAWT